MVDSSHGMRSTINLYKLVDPRSTGGTHKNDWRSLYDLFYKDESDEAARLNTCKEEGGESEKRRGRERI